LMKLNTDDSEYNKVKQIGIRRVLSQHNYSKRLLQIATKLGYDLNETVPTVTFISFVKDSSMIDTVEKVYNNIHGDNKKLLIIVENNLADYSVLINGMSVVTKSNILQNFMTLRDITDSEYVSVLDIDDFYGNNYLNDMLLATSYTNTDIIGKSNYYENEEGKLKEVNKKSEHEYTKNF